MKTYAAPTLFRALSKFPNAIAVLVVVVAPVVCGSASSHKADWVLTSPCTDQREQLPRSEQDKVAKSGLVLFSVPDSTFSVRARTRDLPPGTIYTIVSLNGKGKMEISTGQRVTFAHELDSSFAIFSTHVEERDVRTQTGQLIGKDRWGFLNDGAKWRSTRFFVGEEIAYRPLSPDEAKRLDVVIDSGCRNTSFR